MRGIITAIIIFLFLLPAYALSAGEQNGQLKHTLYRNQLNHAGLVRLSDILSLIDEFDYFSIDGFTWQATLKDFDLYQQQNWILMVNDQTIQTKLFDTIELNLLPFSTDHIDSIDVFIFPQLINSEFSDKGIIHIHTKKIEQGVTLQGQLTAGNRTGDPGPWRYTEYWSENIDRIAADESYWLAYADSNVNVGFGHYVQVYYPTDPRMTDRLRDIYTEHNPYISSKSYMFKAGLSKAFSRPQFEVFQTTMEDLYFFKPAGREIPTNQDFTFMGLSGGEELSGGFNFRYRLFYQKHKLEKRPNKYNYDFDWGVEEFGGDIQSGFYNKYGRSQLGVGVKQIQANTGYDLSQRYLSSGKVYGSYQYFGFTGHSPGISGMYEFGDAGRVINLSIKDKFQTSDFWALTGVFSFSETSILEENTLWYWSESGYDIVSDLGGSYEIEGTLLPAKQWTFDLLLTRTGEKWQAFEGGVSFRRFISKNWEVQPLIYDPEHKTTSGKVMIKTVQSNSRGRLFLKLNYRGPDPISHHLYYHYSTTLETTSQMQDLWKSVPEHRAIYRITYNPVESFSIWSMFKYQSSVFWYDYHNVEEQSLGKYSAQLSDIITFDLAINKWLWDKRIKIDVIFRNIFNRESIYFPIGASLDLRFYAQAEFYFNFL